MRASKFTVEQIAHASRRVESGMALSEMCRELGITETTFYRWKRKFGGIGTPELRELRQLRDENKKLRQVVADLTLDRVMLQDRPLHPDCINSHGGMRERMTGLCVAIDKKDGLGYRGLATMVVFHRNAPNTVPLPVRGSHRQDPWRGVLPRTTDLAPP